MSINILKFIYLRPSMMAHACNPTLSGDGDQEDHSSRTGWAIKIARPHLNKKSWA
jgi:hypothetical protein